MQTLQTSPTLKSPNSRRKIDPWSQPTKSSYQDLIFKDEYLDRQLELRPGTTWMRIIPNKTEKYEWMLPIHAIRTEHFQFVHPKTTGSEIRCVFDDAYAWFKSNNPEALFSKNNRNGFRLLSDRMVAFWVAIQEGNELITRLFLHNGYNGDRGGLAGLGYRVLQLTQDEDENGNPMQEIVDAESGVQIGIEKAKPMGAQFPRYDLHVGRIACPLSTMLTKMSDEEQRAVCPIEDTVRVLTRAEQWPLLAKIVGSDLANRIRGSFDQ